MCNGGDAAEEEKPISFSLSRYCAGTKSKARTAHHKAAPVAKKRKSAQSSSLCAETSIGKKEAWLLSAAASLPTTWNTSGRRNNGSRKRRNHHRQVPLPSFIDSEIEKAERAFLSSDNDDHDRDGKTSDGKSRMTDNKTKARTCSKKKRRDSLMPLPLFKSENETSFGLLPSSDDSSGDEMLFAPAICQKRSFVETTKNQTSSTVSCGDATTMATTRTNDEKKIESTMNKSNQISHQEQDATKPDSTIIVLDQKANAKNQSQVNEDLKVTKDSSEAPMEDRLSAVLKAYLEKTNLAKVTLKDIYAMLVKEHDIKLTKKMKLTIKEKVLNALAPEQALSNQSSSNGKEADLHVSMGTLAQQDYMIMDAAICVDKKPSIRKKEHHEVVDLSNHNDNLVRSDGKTQSLRDLDPCTAFSSGEDPPEPCVSHQVAPSLYAKSQSATASRSSEMEKCKTSEVPLASGADSFGPGTKSQISHPTTRETSRSKGRKERGCGQALDGYKMTLPIKGRKEGLRSSCSLCSSCPCTRGNAKEENASLALSQSDTAIEKALIGRLQKLEKIVARYSREEDALRRRLKTHRRDMWRKRERLMKMGGNTQKSWFLPDAKELDAELNQAEEKKKGMSLHTVKQAQMNVFAATKTIQPTLTQYVGGGEGGAKETNSGAEECNLHESNQSSPTVIHVADSNSSSREGGKGELHQDECLDDSSGFQSDSDADSPSHNRIEFVCAGIHEPASTTGCLWSALVTSEFGSSFDSLFITPSDMENAGMNDLVNMIEHFEEQGDEGAEQVTMSMLDDQDRQSVQTFINLAHSDESILTAIRDVFQSWEENLLFCFHQKDPDTVASAMNELCETEKQLGHSTRIFASVMEKRSKAVRFFWQALEAKSRRMNSCKINSIQE